MKERNARKGFTDALEKIRHGDDVPEDFVKVFYEVALAKVRQHFGPAVRKMYASDEVAVSALVAGINRLKNSDDAPYDGTLGFLRSLCVIAQYKAISAGRKAQRNQKALEQLALGHSDACCPENPVERAEREDSYRNVATRALQLIGQIDDDYTRRLLELRLFEEITWNEVRNQLLDDFQSMKIATVRTLQNHYNSALETIKKQLEDEFPGDASQYFGGDDDSSD